MKTESQNEQDLAAMILKIQEQIAALDRKMDVLIGKAPSRPAENPRPAQVPHVHQPSRYSASREQTPVVHAHDPIPGLRNSQPRAEKPQEPRPPRQQEQRPARPMFHIVCAECKKECEIPFKPREDRPVYCKECFAQRKANGIPKSQAAEVKAPVVSEVPAIVVEPVIVPEAPVKEVVKDKKKPAAKKPAAKKKPVAKKKK